MLLLFDLCGNIFPHVGMRELGLFGVFIHSVRIFLKITWPFLESSQLFVKYKSSCNLSLIKIVKTRKSLCAWNMQYRVCKGLLEAMIVVIYFQ